MSSRRGRIVLDGVPVFVAVAECGSFTGAARRLGISPSAASQAVRGLEERLGTPLLRRSTRAVSLTDVGAAYLRAAAPALAELNRAAAEAAGHAGRPAGPLRLTMPRAPFDLLLADVLAAFGAAFPDVRLEIAVENRLADIVGEGFDAGFRHGNVLGRDVVAVPVAPPSDAWLVASPAYLRARPLPAHPSDLLDHHAILCRRDNTGPVRPWVLRRGDETVEIAPPAATIVHDLASQIELALRGLGIVGAPAASVGAAVEAGTLTRVLPGWFSPVDALFLYFPSRRGQSAALRAFVLFLKERTRGAPARPYAAAPSPLAAAPVPVGSSR